MYCYSLCPQPCSMPTPTHIFTRDYWTTTGKSRTVSCGVTIPFSWVLMHKICCALQESIPQSCVSSGISMVGLMATSSKRTYAIPTPRASVPVADHHRPISPQETLKYSSVSVSVGSLSPGAHRVCLSSLSISGRNGVCSKCKFAPPTILLGLLLCSWTWVVSSTAAPVPTIFLGFL